MLPKIVQALKQDPEGWYKANGITPPAWLSTADKEGESAERLRARYEANFRAAHARYLWAHFFNIALGAWLVTGPPVLNLQSGPLAASDVVSGMALMLFAALSLSWRLAWARWVCAAIGAWVMFAPLVFWAPTAAGYLNDTLVGALVIGFAVALPPEPGVSPLAAASGLSPPRDGVLIPQAGPSACPSSRLHSSVFLSRAISPRTS